MNDHTQLVSGYQHNKLLNKNEDGQKISRNFKRFFSLLMKP